MKKIYILILSGFMAIAFTVGCKNESPKTAKLPEGHPPITDMPQTQAKGFSGKVVETMNASRYTYIRIDTGEKKVWVAAPQFSVETGDSVVVPQGQAMTNHHSKTLNRNFEEIYFVSYVMVGGENKEIKSNSRLVKSHPGKMGQKKDVKVVVSGIDKVEGGQTISELYAEKDKFAGKEVKVRGKVVKYLTQIMKKNWLHIQDGSSTDKDIDLVVTTSGAAKVGDTVIVSGILGINKEFGYHYEVIIENAQLIIE
ncbi:MAG: hypothetical protein JW786_03255 [Desulfobacterales bacterium]|nr:hypothetical protein [Desulfobacterales bacterium]